MQTELVGRQHELETIGRLLARPAVGALVLAGPPGVGKTALARAAAGVAAAAGFTTEKVTATRAAAAIPFGAVAQLLPASRPAGERAELLRQATVAIAERGEVRPFMLVVDDAHLLDDASATLIHQVAMAEAVFLVVTVRTGADAPDPVTALWKDGLAVRLELDALPPAATAELLAALLEGPLGPGLADSLHAASGGNPLYLLQLADAGRRSGALRRAAGEWRLGGRIPLPDDLVAAVEERLGALEPDDRSLLELVAFGEPLGIELLEELAGDGGVDRLESLEERGLLRADRGGRDLEVRLAHPLYAEALRDQAPASWRRRACLRLAEAAEARGLDAGPDQALRVAGWRLEAGAPIPGALSLRASDEARRRADLDLAERVARAGLATEPTFDTHFQVAWVLGLAGATDDALAALDAAEPLATNDEQRMRIACSRTDLHGYHRGDYVTAYLTLQAAEERITDPSFLAEIAARRAYLIGLGGGTREALAILEPILEDRTLSTRARVWVTMAAAFSYQPRGRYELALASAREGRAALASMAWEATVPQLGAFVFNEAGSLLSMGRVDEARAVALDGIAASRSSWTEQSVAWCEWTLAMVERFAGHPQEAARLAGAAADVLTGAQHAICRTEHAVALAQLGLVDEARAALARIPEEGYAADGRSLAEAWCLFAAGDPAGAVAVLSPAALGRRLMVPVRIAALVDLARFGAADAAAPALEEAAGRTDGEAAPALLAFVRALASQRPDDLAASASTLAALGADLLAAEAATAAGAGFAAAGRAGPAAEWRARAAELAERCPGAATPGLRRARARAALTRREHEVASLAVSGLGNRAIAERLGVSKRTVDSQLQKVYEKLGIAGRPELAGALDRPG